VQRILHSDGINLQAVGINHSSKGYIMPEALHFTSIFDLIIKSGSCTFKVQFRSADSAGKPLLKDLLNKKSIGTEIMMNWLPIHYNTV